MWEDILGVILAPLIYWYLRKLNIGKLIQHEAVLIKLICLFSVYYLYIIAWLIVPIAFSISTLEDLSILLILVIMLQLGFIGISKPDLISETIRRKAPYTTFPEFIKSFLLSLLSLIMLFYSLLGLLFWVSFVSLVFDEVEGILGLSILEWLNVPFLDSVLSAFIWVYIAFLSLALFWNGLKPVNSNILDS